MANSRFNKQISPKGYADGGKVKKGKTSPGPKAGKPKTSTTPPKSPRKGLGPAGRSKKKKPSIQLRMGVKEGPAKQNTTIKTFDIYPDQIDGQKIKIK